jgi:hypothetical protein
VASLLALACVVASNVRRVSHEVRALIAALEGHVVEVPDRLLEDGLAALVLDDQLPPHDVHAADLLEVHVPLVPDLLEHKLFVVEALGAQKRDGCSWRGSGGRHARISMRRGPYYGGTVLGEVCDKDSPDGNTHRHRPPRLLPSLESTAWVEARAPGGQLAPGASTSPTAARNGKVDAQLYTSVRGFLYDKVCLKSSSSAGAFQCEPLPHVVRDGP